jgi:hypothetical protein
MWGIALVLAAGVAVAQPDDACKVIYGTGDLVVLAWIGGDPFALVGEFDMAIDSVARMVRFLEDEPERLTWYQGRLVLMGMPGSDETLPGDLAWAPCGTTWTLSRDEDEYTIETFCETILVPTEGDVVFELLMREEVATVSPGLGVDCGRLHVNGYWNSDDDTGVMEVAGKLCDCP